MQFYYQRGDQQFGPMPWEHLVSVARAGSLLPTDLVWAEGWPAWQSAQSVPGLLPAAPPPIPSPRVHAKPLGDDPVARALLPVGRTGWAIVAGYLGLLSFLIVPAPLALLVGILAVFDLKRRPDKHGLGRAVFAIIMGLAGTTLLVVILLHRS